MAGETSSATNTFPGVSGGAQGSSGGGFFDAFVSRFSVDLTTLVQSTYLGAAGSDSAYALVMHPATGDVYVTGETDSETNTFPGVSGGAQDSYGGNIDAFVSRFNANLTALVQSTYLGAAGGDGPTALAMHPATGEVYVAGYTDSATSTFPGVSGGAQDSFGGSTDAFVSRFNANLTTLGKSTYLGAAGGDVVYALAMHPATGEVYVAGYTSSVTPAFPGVSGGAQGSSGGVRDAFVSRFSADLTTLLQSTYLGAAGTDEARALAIHPATGDVYVAGYTTSATSTFPGVSGGAQGSYGGGARDAFVSRFSLDLAAASLPNGFSFAPRINVPAGSLQTSNAVQITGIAGAAPISLVSARLAQYCISSSNGCACDVQPYASTAGTIANNQFACVRQNAPGIVPGVADARLIVGGRYASFLVTTGTLVNACSLDVDGNSNLDALTDGLIMLRAMFGLTGTSVTTGAIGAGATRSTWAQLQAYLNGNCGASFAP